MNIQFDTLKEEYVEALANLDKECFTIPWSLNLFTKELSNSTARYTLAFDGSELIGYGAYYSVAGEGSITNIAVLPYMRQKGIGAKILEKMIDSAKNENLDFLTLEVRESNIKAIGLYKKFGFKLVGARKGYYSDNGETALLMTRQL